MNSDVRDAIEVLERAGRIEKRALDGTCAIQKRPSCADDLFLLRLSNSSGKAVLAFLSVTIDGTTKPFKVVVDPGAHEYKYRGEMQESKSPMEVTVNVEDSLGRLIVSSSQVVVFGGKHKDIAIDASIEICSNPAYSEDEWGTLAVVTMSTESADAPVCTVACSVNGIEHSSMVAVPVGGMTYPVMSPHSLIPGCAYEVSVSVYYGSRLLASSKGVITVSVAESDDHSECEERTDFDPIVVKVERAQEWIDVHDCDREGQVTLMRIKARSVVDGPSTYQFIAETNGNVWAKDYFEITTTERTIDLKRPALEMYRDVPTQFTVNLSIRNRNEVVYRVSRTSVIRSRFDMDLSKCLDRIPLWVDPTEPALDEIMKCVAFNLEREGQNAIATGYQEETRILPQIKAVCEAISDWHLVYSSETFTPVGEGNFQRVRTPEVVLKEGNLNCIEGAILFASVFERMGLDPAVIISGNHALAGVVLRSASGDPLDGLVGLNSNYIQKYETKKGREIHVLPLETTICSGAVKFDEVCTVAHNHLSHYKKSLTSLIADQRRKGLNPIPKPDHT